jgi:ArsR family transcriptional regulator
VIAYLDAIQIVAARKTATPGDRVATGYYTKRIEVMTMAADWDEVDLMDKDEHIEQASRAMKAMSHPLRLKILCVLGDKEVSVQDIVDHVGTSQSNISQHLAILRDKGVLRTRKDANRVYYRVGDTRTLKLLGMMRDVFCGFTK